MHFLICSCGCNFYYLHRCRIIDLRCCCGCSLCIDISFYRYSVIYKIVETIIYIPIDSYVFISLLLIPLATVLLVRRYCHPINYMLRKGMGLKYSMSLQHHPFINYLFNDSSHNLKSFPLANYNVFQLPFPLNMHLQYQNVVYSIILFYLHY
jgi:hypothetical protein